MKKIRLGILGLGQRGEGLLTQVVLNMEEFEVVALSDIYEDRVKRCQEHCKMNGFDAKGYLDSYELLENESLDAVLISTAWDSHIDLSIEAMRRNIAVALEVGGAYDLHDLWKLVDVYEQTKTPFMLMENCCFGRLEMMTLNMAENGVLGEIVYASGGYLHELRDEISEGNIRHHYRLENYMKRNCENYPTHEVGPIAKILKINEGNRFITISSQSSKAVGLNHYINRSEDCRLNELKDTRFAQGDIVTTTIKCANGELISLRLDTTLPRYYSRGFYIQGTKGLVNEDNRSIYLEEDTNADDHFTWEKNLNNIDAYYEKYEHPVWNEYLEQGVRAGHDGMDYLVFKSFADSLINNEKMAIDVYDAAAWMAITTLSEQSISLGGQVLAFPDFTSGKWMKG